MALPKENRTVKTDAVEAEIKKMGPKDLAALPGLDGDDFRVFGTLIQHFCFIDLNLRRALELFHLSGMLPESAKKLYPNLPEAKLTETFLEIVNGMDAKTEDKATALIWIELISKTRGYRNLVGHFAGKRFPGHDVYVFASKSEKDARKVLGFGLAEHRVHTVVAGRSDFAEMVKSVEQAQLWLANRVPVWDEQYLKRAKPNVAV
jgi:hypothetical protein